MRVATAIGRALPFSLLALLTLGGCADQRIDDLEVFIDEVKARRPGRIEPIPELKQIETFIYDPAGRRDPFDSVIAGVADNFAEQPASGISPDPNRRKEELETFPLDSLRMVGTLEQNDSRWGLIVTQEGTIYRVRPGNYMGQNNGQISRVTEDRIELSEIVPDGLGGYREREASIALAE